MNAGRAALVVFLLVGCGGERAPDVGGTTLDSAAASPISDSLLAAGHEQYRAHEYDKATSYWTSSLARARATDDSALQAELYTWLGLALWRRGAVDSARALEERALAIKSKLARPHELWRTYNALGLIALDGNLNDSAAALFEKAGAAAGTEKNAEGVAKAAGNAALAYSYLGDLPRARAGHRQMRMSGRDLRDPRLEANGLANEALVDIWEGDPIAAMSRLDTARRIYRATNDAVGEANALGQLATAYQMTGDFRSAFAALDSAIATTRRFNLSSNTIEMLRLLGGLHSQIGDNRRAIAYFDEAEKLSLAGGADGDLGAILRGAARARFRLGNSRRAVAQARQALELHRESDEPFEQIDDLLLLAEMHEMSGEKAEAAARLSSATELAHRLGNAHVIATLLVAKAAIADRQGREKEVLQILSPGAIDTLRANFEQQAAASALRSRAYLKLGLLDSAVAAGGRAIEAADKVRANLAAPVARSAWTSEKSEVYSDFIVALLSAGKIEEAFAVADRARSRALIENLGSVRDGGGGEGLPRELLEGERLLRRIDALMEALARTMPPRIARGGQDPDAANPLVKELGLARAEYERLRVRAGEFTAVPGLRGSARLDFARLRSVLDPDEAVIEYFLRADSALTFVMTKHGVSVHAAAATPAELWDKLRLLKDLWGGPRPDWEIGLGISRQLHQALVGPALRSGKLRGIRKVVIVPHGLLAQVPFAALQNPGTGRFMVEDFSIGMSPSAAALTALRGRPRGRSRLAGAALAPFGRELPGTRREVEQMASLDRRTLVLKDHKATEAQLRKLLASGRSIHVASHGVLNHLNPMFSRLELAPGTLAPGDNGRFEVHELLGLELSSQLVFLSGCETGASEEWSDGSMRATGDLALSLAFLAAGAKNVASTLWRIDDSGAAEVTRRFYVAARRLPVTDALSSAQRSLVRHPRLGKIGRAHV